MGKNKEHFPPDREYYWTSAVWYPATGRASKGIRQSIRLRDRILVNDHWILVCSFCKKYVKFEEATVDHIIPRSRGGTHFITNLQFLHKHCNVRKGSRLV